jgi:hypothetical protein
MCTTQEFLYKGRETAQRKCLMIMSMSQAYAKNKLVCAKHKTESATSIDYSSAKDNI